MMANHSEHALNNMDKTPKKLTQGQFEFLEGPVWYQDALLFVDLKLEKIFKYNPKDGQVSVFRDASEGTNGMLVDANGRLLGCEGNIGRVIAMNENGAVTEVLADTFQGKRFNRPNDLVMDRQGGIYFTYPTWEPQIQPVNGVYYIHPDGTIDLLVDDMDKPNGIVLSPDGKYLYIDDSHSDTVRRYRIVSPGKIEDKTNFAVLNCGSETSYADGMAMDTDGNLLVTYRHGIDIFNAEGKRIGFIEGFDSNVSNCTFGGNDNKTLYMTAGNDLYSIVYNTPGCVFQQKE